MSDILRRLSREGVSVWLDDISRERLAGGGLARLVRERHVVGVTSNPTIFAQALASARSACSGPPPASRTPATPTPGTWTS
ncbi:transaldolase family protein [Saccharothrix sp. ST-888]|uniref:transaldolase family protein n=1 Tax=Saccharothrix sp. ST-888 TaxID=1427391 RepID=UPI000ABB3B16|nr:transaldolase family protein [Saccharothrix sp. ST-888]